MFVHTVYSGASLPPALLFFGCRHPEIDFLYREELEAAVQSGALTSLVTAFSREQVRPARCMRSMHLPLIMYSLSRIVKCMFNTS